MIQLLHRKKPFFPIFAWITLAGAGFSSSLPAVPVIPNEISDSVQKKLNFVTTSDGTYNIALHTYDAVPRITGKRGTFFVLHGYLEHTETRLPLIKYLQNKGYDVLGIDLPGHGISGGARADVDNFGSYTAALEAALDYADGRNMMKPYNIIAHSTGCSAVLQFICESELRQPAETNEGKAGGSVFEHIIMESPLVRSRLWRLTKMGTALISPIIATVPAGFTGTTDQASINALKEDPLVPRKIPVHWVQELIEYEEKSRTWPVSQTKMLILFGQKDHVIDTKYTMPFLKEKFPQAEIVELPGSYHHILKDVQEVSHSAWEKLDEWIGE